MSLPFAEIVWPKGWELPWLNASDEKLRERHGEPFYTNDKGALTGINEEYWAGLHAAEHEVLFEPDELEFYAYKAETGLYEVESMDAVRNKVSSRMLEASRQAKVFDLEKRRTAKTLNSIISHLRGLVEKRDAFKEKRKTIHLANGVVVFNGTDAELQPFSPDFRSRNRSPIAFDENAKCERFLNELVLPAVHSEDVELLQRFAGMMLLGHNRAQRFLILDGEAGRGKTQFANVMQGLIGMANVTQLRTKHLADRFELYRYIKKTLLVGVDVEAEFLSTKGAAVLKGLVGGDWFDAEQKGGTGCFQMQGTFNVLITSNARLRVRLQGDVGAWRRRLNIVRYEAPPPARKIPDFGGYLVRTEGSGILNWALEGAQKVLTEIPDEGGDFALTARQRGIVDSLLAESEWTLTETRTPLRLGKPLPLIPFVFHGPRNSLPSIDKLPLTDLIAVNLDHYRLDADYKHGMHFTALPTAWVSGFDKDEPLRIGSSTAWHSETPGATAGFLEFTGQGLMTFERAMDRDEKQLAVLGSRLLESQKRVGETAQAIELRQSGENSVLANVATSLSESLTQALRWVYWWNSTEETPEALTDNVVVMSLNTDFTTAGMDSNELREIVAAWQAGAISQDTMLELFRRGEILPDGRTNADEVALIDAGAKKEQQTAQLPAAAAAPTNQPMAA